MSIQQSINQAVTLAAALGTQTPKYQAKVAAKQEEQRVSREITAIKKQLSPEAQISTSLAGISTTGRAEMAVDTFKQAKELYKSSPSADTAALLREAGMNVKGIQSVMLQEKRIMAMKEAKAKQQLKQQQKMDIKQYMNLPVSAGGVLGDYPESVQKAYLEAINGKK